MKKLCGLDINGWHDFVCYKDINPEENTEKERTPILKEVVESAIIIAGNSNSQNMKLVTDIQTILAPHGKGEGWGEIGNSKRRILIRDCLSNLKERENKHLKPISALIETYGKDCHIGVFSLDDLPSSSEFLRECILGAMSRANIRYSLLVWRPILAVLYAIKKGIIKADHKKIGVVCHSTKGFSIQNIIIEIEDSPKGKVLVPKREVNSNLFESSIGYFGLRKLAKNSVKSKLKKENSNLAEMLRTTAQLSLGLPSTREFYRKPNGNWDFLDPPNNICISNDENFNHKYIQDPELILFETLTERAVNNEVEYFVKSGSASEVIVLPNESIALGALEAAYRYYMGIPVYFDFLPQISTIVWDDENQHASNKDLIEISDNLPAGKIYHSTRPAKFEIPKGRDKIEIYLRKELRRERISEKNKFDDPRKSVVELSPPFEKNTQVDLWVEQKPAAGRAKIVLESLNPPFQRKVDWEEAMNETRKWERIIEDLSEPITIPDRLVLSATINLWNDFDNTPGLRQLLKLAKASQPDWNILANKLSSRINNEYCISSDGEFPSEICPGDEELLREIQNLALKHTLRRVKGEIRENRNDALRFLTWLFKRCNDEVIPEMFNALKLGMGNHPFNWSPGNQRLFYQGLGRIINETDHIKMVFTYLFSIPDENWKSTNQVACAAFLLSRTEKAVNILEREDVDRIARIGVKTLSDAITQNQTFTLYYPPFLMAGLLRWRKIKKGALIANNDDYAADIMYKTVKETIPIMEIRAQNNQNLDNLVEVLKEVKKLLEGKGRPDILSLIAENLKG